MTAIAEQKLTNELPERLLALRQRVLRALPTLLLILLLLLVAVLEPGFEWPCGLARRRRGVLIE